ncbi:unnamed protein product [Rhizoctonia solani]|uniref:Uncharacterized protein n=1 Tax=Rhizoctonia solani TaxID=456999 RepID=A0A8H3E8Z7_9AGAM|nr:unnamed protein product [Rhizoctonia solani]
MTGCVSKPNGLEIELLTAQGGKIPYDLFYHLVVQLEKSRLLDNISPLSLATLPAKLGAFDVIYVILQRGSKKDTDEDGNRLYAHITCERGWKYWLAGVACLVFPTSGHQRGGDDNTDTPGDTADISIALLPAAQKLGYGRFVIKSLVHHAFNTLHIPRVTASVVCPVQPHYSAATKKQVIYNSKQLCWIFEKSGFKFEGISRGAVKCTKVTRGEPPVWHDVYRMSMLQTDYFARGKTYLFSHTHYFLDETPTRKVPRNPWESMMQRQEEEKRDVQSWRENTKARFALASDACESENEDENGDEDSDEDTILGDDAGSDPDWDMTNDFDDQGI